MKYKLIALYRQPEDVTAFERHYRDVHCPLVEKVPGLERVVLNYGAPAPWGGEPPFYLVAEMVFPDEATFNTAMASPENAAAGKDLRGFAKGIVSLMVAREG